MRNLKITIEYKGTNYHGWQRQNNAVSIQEALEVAIEKITREKVTLTGSGRTDCGVHARGQVANFFSSTRIPADRLPSAINSQLPKDIVVVCCEEESEGFHSRYSAQGKEYSYTIYNKQYQSPFYSDTSWHIPYSLDLSKMIESCKYFVGTYDFVGFMSTGSSIKTTVRSIYTFELNHDNGIITFTTRGNGYLYNMVRIMVGTIVEVGKGKIQPNELPGIIASKERNNAGPTAPAQGLCLERVFYQ